MITIGGNKIKAISWDGKNVKKIATVDGKVIWQKQTSSVPSKTLKVTYKDGSTKSWSGITSVTSSYVCGSTTVVKAEIGSGVVSIGFKAFASCTSLSSITLSDTITTIGDGAFQSCSSLGSIYIPSSVTSIGNGTLQSCSSLSSITVDSNNTVYDSRDNCNAIIQTATNVLWQGCKTTVIPTAITSIRDYAFQRVNITSLVIPSGITSVGTQCFYECTSLTSLICKPTTAPTLGTNALAGASSSGTLHYPNGSDYSKWLSTLGSGWKGVADA